MIAKCGTRNIKLEIDLYLRILNIFPDDIFFIFTSWIQFLRIILYLSISRKRDWQVRTSRLIIEIEKKVITLINIGDGWYWEGDIGRQRTIGDSDSSLSSLS